MQTPLHLLYFLPALIVYGLWTWTGIRTWKIMVNNGGYNPNELLDFCGIFWLSVHLTVAIAGIIYFVGFTLVRGRH